MTPSVTVVGGTYHEQVTEPESHRLAGPGMRAAALLVSMGHSVDLHTYVDEATTDEAIAVANALGVTLMTAPRSKPIRFSYATPLAHPIVNGSINETTTCG
jgi:hypothetical protein